MIVNDIKWLAAQELHHRQHARHNILDFTTYTLKSYRAGRHHRLLCQKLQEIAAGNVKRLMVFMPPRHGKSELTSRRFPSWFLGKNPTQQVIVASYSGRLASSFGRDIRQIVASSLFKNIFPQVSLAKDSSARHLFHTNQGGVCLTAGVGGSLTGYGAHLAIIDDPVKDRHHAESETLRNTTWEWYQSVLRTRLMPEGAILLVQTRWHVDDLAGRLIQEMQNGTGEVWDIVNLPARAQVNDPLHRQEHEPLWPETFDDQALHQIERSIGQREWQALYQGEPMRAMGSFFKLAQIRIMDHCVPAHPCVRRWDFAASKPNGHNDPDWTVGVKMQRNRDDSYTIMDVVRFRGLPDEVEHVIQGVASQDGGGVSIVLPQDPGQAGIYQVRYLTKQLSGYRVHSVRETGSKTRRADPFAAQINSGNVTLLRGAWNQSFLEELQAFPYGRHDDQIDAASGAFAQLTEKKHLPRMPDLFNLALERH